MYGLAFSLLLFGFKENIADDPQSIDCGLFNFKVPKSWKKIEIAPNDCYSGGYVIDSEDTVFFRLVLQSNEALERLEVIDSPLTNSIKTDTINGRPVKILSPINPGWGITGVFFDSLVVGDGSKLLLSFYGKNLKAASQMALLDAVKTIKFNLYSFKKSSPLSAIISKLFLESDSVFLIRNTPTVEYGFKIVEDVNKANPHEVAAWYKKYPPNKPIIISDRFNWKIVRRKTRLTKHSTKKLVEILTTDSKIEIDAPPRCGDYLHLIVSFNREEISYLAINFCNRSITCTKNIPLEDSHFDLEKWQKLSNFFLKNRINPSK